jgi:dolichol-phosphate mannosyltransferase
VYEPESPKRVAVVASAYNEASCVDELAQRLARVFDGESQYEWEVIVVENGSTDHTWERLQAIHYSDARFKIVRLARNFRMDGGLTAGLDFVDADACVLMAADLQDPPELIPEFLREWEQGYHNVYGVVTERNGTGPIRTFNSRAFYWLAGKLTDGRIPRNASDFRLLDRRAYKVVQSMQERNRFVRGLVAWVGFESVGVPMVRPPRFAGESKAHSLKVIELAFRGIFAHSYVPLRLITVFGVVSSLLAFMGLALSVFLWLTRGVPFGGFGTIVSLVLLLFGVLAFMLGILSEYVGLIYEEVKGRPNYVVSSTLGVAGGGPASGRE